MRRLAIAFTGAALFVGGLDLSPNFAAEKPQASAGASIDPIALNVVPCVWGRPRSPRSFEKLSFVDPEEEIDKDGKKPINQPYPTVDAQPDTLIWLGNAHEFRRATASAPMGCFTTSRRKFSKHFS
jgi:hypothetical protein